VSLPGRSIQVRNMGDLAGFRIQLVNLARNVIRAGVDCILDGAVVGLSYSVVRFPPPRRLWKMRVVGPGVQNRRLSSLSHQSGACAKEQNNPCRKTAPTGNLHVELPLTVTRNNKCVRTQTTPDHGALGPPMR